MKISYKCKCGRKVKPKIIPPPKKHEVAFYNFVRAVVDDFPDDIPEHGKRRRKLVRVTAKKRDWFIPRARGSKHDLVPPPRVEPCTLCDNARYNRLCAEQDDCIAYAYWVSTEVLFRADTRKEITVAQIVQIFANKKTNQKDQRPCGAIPAKFSNLIPMTKRSVSSAGLPYVSPRMTSSATAREK